MSDVPNQLPDTVVADNAMLSVIERVACDPNSDVEKLEKMLDMQERILAKNAEIAFNQAMARLQPKLPVIKKSSKAHNSTYAKYEDIDPKIRPLYTSEGFSISFNSKREGDLTYYYGTLKHSEGHSVTAEIDLPNDTSGSKNPIQAKASTITYAKRYLLTMLLNIVTTDEDDDGATGGAKLITEQEEKVLLDLIKRSGADKKKFLAHMKVDELNSLPSSQFKKAENALMAKIRAGKK